MKNNGLIGILTLMVSFLLMAFLPACIERPEGVLSEDETIDLMVDMQITEAYLNTMGPSMSDSMRQAMAEGVLLQHGVSKKQLEQTLAYYGRNADEYYALFDKVNKRLDSKRKNLTGQMPTESTAENNIWPYSPFALFARNGSSDGLIFSLTGDALDPGEMLEWKMRLNNSGQGDALLGVEYGDGSSTYVKRSVGGMRNVKIDLQSDTGKVIKRVFGYFNVSKSSMPLWVDSIRLDRLPFDSVNYSKVRNQSRYYGAKNRPKEMKTDSVANPAPDSAAPQQEGDGQQQSDNQPAPPATAPGVQRSSAPAPQRPGNPVPADRRPPSSPMMPTGNEEPNRNFQKAPRF